MGVPCTARPSWLLEPPSRLNHTTRCSIHVTHLPERKENHEEWTVVFGCIKVFITVHYPSRVEGKIVGVI